MKEVILASNNKHKIKEYKVILECMDIKVISQQEAGIDIEVEETGKTFKENALLKAKAIYDKVHKAVISDDSGLIIDYLDGMPGVYSHRFLGEDTPYEEKCNKVIQMLENAKEDERTARFVCDICYIDENGENHIFEGVCEGTISNKIMGVNGFAYDRIFLYDNDKTFAQMSEEEKDKISHRRRAIDKFVEYLK